MLPLLVLGSLIVSGMLLSKTTDALPPSDDQQLPASTASVDPYGDHGLVTSARRADAAAGAAQQARSESGVYSPLRGKVVPTEQFTLSNSEPFYRGAAPGAMRERDPATVPAPRTEKRESRGWDRQEVGSKQSDLAAEAARYGASLSTMRTSIPLMQPTREHALNPESLARVLPPTVDELRIASNPRIENAGRIVPGKSVTTMRGEVPCVPKRTPDSFKATTFEDFLPMTGPAARESERPTELLHATARGLRATDWVAPAGSGASSKWGVTDTASERDPRYLMPALPGGGAAQSGAWSAAAQNPAQYGEALRDNERNLSTAFPMVGMKAAPGTSYVTADDQQRGEWNKKTITTGGARVYGNMRGTAAFKGEMYDPNMVARTTAKETMIHDTSVGMLGPMSPDRGVTREPDAQAPMTIRNTLCTPDSNVNLVGVVKPQVYDPTDVFDPTHRDTITTERGGNVSRSVLQTGRGYETNEVEARGTNAQLNLREHFGGADALGDGDGYKIAMPDGMYPTVKSAVGDNGVTFGSAGTTGAKKGMSYEAIYARAMRDTKERLLAGRAPTTVGPSLMKGSQDPDLVMECSRDPALMENDRLAGNVGRQGAMQNHGGSNTCQDGRGTNGLPNWNTRLDGSESVALRSNPYAQDISKPPRGGVAFKMSD